MCTTSILSATFLPAKKVTKYLSQLQSVCASFQVLHSASEKPIHLGIFFSYFIEALIIIIRRDFRLQASFDIIGDPISLNPEMAAWPDPENYMNWLCIFGALDASPEEHNQLLDSFDVIANEAISALSKAAETKISQFQGFDGPAMRQFQTMLATTHLTSGGI